MEHELRKQDLDTAIGEAPEPHDRHDGLSLYLEPLILEE